MIRAEAETCFETKYENKYIDASLAFDDRKFRAHKGPNNQKHKYYKKQMFLNVSHS